MDAILSNSPAVQPEPPANTTLLENLAVLNRTRQVIEMLTDFMREHYREFTDLQWRFDLAKCEVVMRGPYLSHPRIEAAEIARRFPGEWKCGVAYGPWPEQFLDWEAKRGEVTLRIAFAEKVAPCAVAPTVVIF